MAKFSFKEVAPCLFAIFIDILGFGLVAPLLVVLFTSSDHNVFHISSSTLQYFYLGLTLALYPLLMFFGTSFIGDLSDIIGRKKTLIICMLGMTCSFLVMGVGIIWASLAIFLIGRSLAGLVSASQSVALATISDLSTNENKAIHLSYVSLIQCLGFVIGPLMGGILSKSEFYLPFFGAAVFAGIAAIWIWFAFEETFAGVKKRINVQHFLNVFKNAYQNERVRTLCLVFLLMQIGVGLCLTVTLMVLNTQFKYSTVKLGIYNGYLGIGFALGLLVALPKLLKRYKVEQIVHITLFATFILQLLNTFFLKSQVAIWLLAFPFGIAVQTAFSTMFTSFSNAADASSQGWVMGISVAVMAIAWAIAGFSSQLILLFGYWPLILIGSICFSISSWLMYNYCKVYI